MTSTTRRPPLPALTGLRAVAAGWVVLFHYRDDLLALVPGLAPLDTFMRAGYLGVDLFFPLSGFVLAYTYADRLGSFSWRGSADFVRNRFARVWPVHVLTLNLDLAVAALVGTLGVGADGHRRTPRAYVENVAMVHTWFNDRPSFNAPAWSISSEWFAYLLAPLLFVRAVRVRRSGPALVLAAASYAAMLASSRRWRCRTATSSTCSTCGSWASSSAGCCSASPGCAVVPGWVGCVVVLPATLVVLAVVPAAAAGTLLGRAGARARGRRAGRRRAGWVTTALSWPGLVAAGEASYALYMTHLLVQPFVHSLRLWAQGSAWASALVVAGSWSCSPRWPGWCTWRSSDRPGAGSRPPVGWSRGRRAPSGSRNRCDDQAVERPELASSLRLDSTERGLRRPGLALR